jgi:transcriptional regulator with XRE-family HTH domain
MVNERLQPVPQPEERFEIANQFGPAHMVTSAQLRGARGLLGWSQADLAARAKVARVTLARIENGAHFPVERTLDAIVAALAAAGITFVDTQSATGVLLARVSSNGA